MESLPDGAVGQRWCVMLLVKLPDNVARDFVCNIAQDFAQDFGGSW